MTERRNYYRILHTQPDAPMAVIRANYRTLMQKLQLHPDLGGPHWGASLLNVAYAALRDPVRRAAYDLDLLSRYDIRALSQGNTASGQPHEPADTYGPRLGSKNLRNYYRILQIQHGAPPALVKASFQTLLQDTGQDKALLEEAFRVLSDPDRRTEYDALLADAEHAGEPCTEMVVQDTIAMTPENDESPGATATSQYRARVIHYCTFCKTPYSPQMNQYQEGNCLDCSSPLSKPSPDLLEQSRRALTRIKGGGKLTLYRYWPDTAQHGEFQDLSPTGVRFLTSAALHSGDVVKLDAENICAVAQVTHGRIDKGRHSFGARFLTIAFLHMQGNFFAARI